MIKRRRSGLCCHDNVSVRPEAEFLGLSSKAEPRSLGFCQNPKSIAEMPTKSKLPHLGKKGAEMGTSDQIQRNIQYSHWHCLCFGITVLFLGISLCNAGESKEVDWKSPSSAQLHLFQKVKAIAETGSLFDPDTIAKILETDFQTTTTGSVTPADCARKTRLRQTTNLYPSAPFWYRVLPSGVGNVQLPAISINQAFKSGDAKFSYEVTRQVQCDDTFQLQDSTKAEMTFIGLPSFACVTEDEMKKNFPTVKFRPATDGAMPYEYQGKINDDAGTWVRFSFYFGSHCALSISIEQDQLTGLRYRRAESKYRNCEYLSARQFCENHAPFGLHDTTAMKELKQHVTSACGTIDSIYKFDTEKDTQPGAWPKGSHMRRKPGSIYETEVCWK